MRLALLVLLAAVLSPAAALAADADPLSDLHGGNDKAKVAKKADAPAAEKPAADKAAPAKAADKAAPAKAADKPAAKADPKAGKPGKPPPPAPVFAYIVAEDDPTAISAPCDAACVKAAAARVKGRRGVKKVTVQGDAVELEIQPGVFKASEVIRGVEGMKVEMRVPYKTLELHFLPDGPFPPVSRSDGDSMILEVNEGVRKGIEAATKARIPTKMKCTGKLTGAEAAGAILTRYEEEKRPPSSMIPFMTETDLDGDKKPDLYLRLDNVGEVVVFNDLKAMSVKPGDPEALVRCDATPTRFVRSVAKQKVKCMAATAHGGDAVERVQVNQTSDLLLFDKGKFTTCEPLGEGAMPSVPRPAGGGAPKTEPKPADEW